MIRRYPREPRTGDRQHCARWRRCSCDRPRRAPKLLEAVRDDDRLRALDQAELILFLAGTGCRLGEALAIRWPSVDLEAGTVRIEANVIRAHGRGVILQDHPKTKAGVRTISN